MAAAAVTAAEDVPTGLDPATDSTQDHGALAHKWTAGVNRLMAAKATLDIPWSWPLLPADAPASKMASYCSTVHPLPVVPVELSLPLNASLVALIVHAVCCRAVLRPLRGQGRRGLKMCTVAHEIRALGGVRRGPHVETGRTARADAGAQHLVLRKPTAHRRSHARTCATRATYHALRGRGSSRRARQTRLATSAVHSRAMLPAEHGAGVRASDVGHEYPCLTPTTSRALRTCSVSVPFYSRKEISSIQSPVPCSRDMVLVPWISCLVHVG